ncbi:MAG: hypothetical protein CFE44_13350 [Burkholderiales bacterium PBB4]|nr:MAG: hypothetical protein CFE44_13350 [Burkholderiales bacterium PBB4]
MAPPNTTTNRRSSSDSDRRRRERRSAAEQLAAVSHGLSGVVPFQLRGLEPLVGGALALYTLWASVVLHASGGAQWPMVAYAAAIGLWARQTPARVQSGLLLRASLLLVGAQFIFASGQSGGPGGPYIVWPCLTVVFYGLLLTRAWALSLVALAIGGFVAVGWLLRGEIALMPAANGLAFLALACGLAILFGERLRVSGEKTESSLRDDRSQLYNEVGLFVHGAQMLADCRRKGRPFSMVLLHGSDLKDIPELVGRRAATDLFGQMVKAIGAVPVDGIAARIEGAEFVLLMPGQDANAAKAQVHQRLGNPPRVELRIKGKPVSIVLDMVVGQPADAEQDLEAFYDTLHHELQGQAQAHSIQTQASLLDIEIVATTTPRRASAPTVPMELEPSPKPRRRT